MPNTLDTVNIDSFSNSFQSKCDCNICIHTFHDILLRPFFSFFFKKNVISLLVHRKIQLFSENYKQTLFRCTFIYVSLYRKIKKKYFWIILSIFWRTAIVWIFKFTNLKTSTYDSFNSIGQWFSTKHKLSSINLNKTAIVKQL